jgi:catechol 2,3-dioxygenase-like lactoylglutathione lyase family enzyme
MHHAGFTVSDIDRSLEFYRDLLGLKVIQDVIRENLPAYDKILGFPDVKIRVALLLDQNDKMIELVEYIQPRREAREQKNTFVGAGHTAFQVADLQAEYEKLAAAGVGSISEPVSIIRDGKLVGKGMYVLDPDGISVELLELAAH